MHCLIHANPWLEWQSRYSAALQQGLVRAGHNATITHDPYLHGELSILLGPHFAKKYHPERCIFIDRAFWGDPNAVSMYWMENGNKIYHWHGRGGRTHPELKETKHGTRTVVLNDFDEQFNEPNATVRHHPARVPCDETLQDCLGRHDVAIGGRSTALVEAFIQGLQVESRVHNGPVPTGINREYWIRSLSWHNWGIDEIACGDLWNYWFSVLV